MDLRRRGLGAKLALWLALPLAVDGQQAMQQGGTLVIAGQSEQAPVVRIRGKAYVDLDSLAKITHGSIQYQGNQMILTLPQAGTGSSASSAAQASGQSSAPAEKRPQISGAFAQAEVVALASIRDWRAALVSAVQNNYPVTDDWVSKLRRTADSQVQLAAAAAATDPDQKVLGLLRNEYTNMQQESDGFVAMHSRVNYTSPDTFENNDADTKIVKCEQALSSMAASKQYQDELACH